MSFICSRYSLIEKEEEIIVGLNKFQLDEEVNPDLLKVDEKLEKSQANNLQNIRQNRDQDATNQVLA
jgi:methylmalonyl-CoA mutase, N-terminal domain